MRRRLLLSGLVLGLATLLPASASATRLYVDNNSSGAMVAFNIGSDGSLTVIPCSSSQCSASSFVEGLTITPDNRFLYAMQVELATVGEFAIGSSGSPSNLCGGSCAATGGSDPIGGATSPNGKFVFASNQDSGTVTPFSVGSGGALTAVTCGTGCHSQAGSPDGLAITPNGKFMYAADQDESVDEWSIGSSGALTQLCTISSCPEAVGDPIPAVITPDGKYLYIGDRDGGVIYAFQIGSGGALTAIPCVACLGGSGLADLAIAPNGKYLYSANQNADSISAFTINSDGTLTPISCSACTAGSNPYVSVAVESGSRYAYALINSGNGITVAPFSIGSGGSLTALSCSPSICTMPGGSVDVFDLAISPDQAPVAKFAHGTARVGKSTSFNGSGSTAYQTATVARYDWSFGDGKKALNGGPKPKHKYAKPGTHKVTLTVTDSLGCSTSQVFTGQTMSCNGSSVATITHKVHVTAVKKATLSLRNLPTACVRANTTIGVRVHTGSGSAPHKTNVTVDGHRVAHSQALSFSVTISLGRLKVGSNTVSAVSVDRFGRHSKASADIKRCSTSAAFTG